MAKINLRNGVTSVVLRVMLLDNTSMIGAGKTGLTSASSGLRIAIISDVEATSTAYTAAGSTTETITTLGTFAAPTATKCRFKEVDATNHPGLYEIQIADARYAVSGARSAIVTVQCTGVIDVSSEIQFYIPDVFREITVESQGTITAQQALSIILAACAGEWTAAGTFKTPNGAATRIAGTAAGSAPFRTSTTLTPSS